MFKNISRTRLGFAVSLVLLAALTTTVGSANAGFTAKVNNASNTVGSGASLLNISRDGTTQCSSVPASGSKIPSTDFFNCNGDHYSTVPVSVPGRTSIDLTQTGAVDFRSATYQAAGCGPVRMNNQANTSNPMLIRGSMSLNQAQATRLAGANSVRLGGSSGYFTNVVPTTGLQTFSISTWFRTDTAQGALFSWTPAATAQIAGKYDRGLYFQSDGKLAFSTFPSNTVQTVVTPAAYNDNVWHNAIVTVQSNVTASTSRATIYMDGTNVASLSIPYANAAMSTSSGYWRVGQGEMTTASGYSGSGEYFKGNISMFSVQPSVYTATQINGISNPGTYVTYANRINQAGPQSFWPLNDNGLDTFAGPYPIIGNQNMCDHVQITIGTDTKCTHPNRDTPCPELSSLYTLKTLGDNGPAGLTPSTAGSPQKINFAVARDDDYNVQFDFQVRMLLPVTIIEDGFVKNTFFWNANSLVI